MSNSSHFVAMLNSNSIKPVALPPGRAKLSTKPEPTGSLTIVNTTGTARVASSRGPALELPPARMTSGASAANSAACLRISAALVAAQRIVDVHVTADGPAQKRQPLQERSDAGLPYRIVCDGGQKHADTPHPLGLLSPRRQRPRRRAAEQRDELATFHSIELHPLPQPGTSMAAYRIGEDQVRGSLQCGISTRLMTAWVNRYRFGRDHLSTNVRFPSNADRKFSA